LAAAKGVEKLKTPIFEGKVGKSVILCEVFEFGFISFINDWFSWRI
jgi:hypothetical protein